MTGGGLSDAPGKLCSAKAKRQQQMFYLCESEAAATNVLSVRKRSGSNKCFYLCESEASATNVFICAKAKRQQQMFYLCESEAAATNVLSVRKRSVSNKCFICAKAKRQQQMFLCAKAKRQQQCAQPELKSPHALIKNITERGNGMDRQKLMKLTLTAMVAAICAVGAVIKIPTFITTAALDSAPALLSVVFLSPVLAGIAGVIGHFITALTTGFPLGPLHLIIAVEMFIVVWVFGVMHKKECISGNGLWHLFSMVLLHLYHFTLSLVLHFTGHH